MTAPDQCCVIVRKLLPWRRPQMALRPRGPRRHPPFAYFERPVGGGKVINRRKFLYAASVGGASAAFPTPAISQGMRELKMVTSWPKGVPGLQGSAERLAQAITTVTSCTPARETC